MLLFILSNYTTIRCSHFVSIHLMLLFIVSDIVFYMQLFCFNTSHVTLYPEKTQCWMDGRVVSIHLMLLFIGIWKLEKVAEILFQYISCYSLSCEDSVESRSSTQFQYISCYSLSKCQAVYWKKKEGFNTSHVTLYPSPAASSELPGTVSIHLMLLFIPCDWISGDCHRRVSIHLMLLFIWKYMTNRNTAEVSIHLMLLFIGVRIGHIQDTMDVSIHLMLLFIQWKEE